MPELAGAPDAIGRAAPVTANAPDTAGGFSGVDRSRL